MNIALSKGDYKAILFGLILTKSPYLNSLSSLILCVFCLSFPIFCVSLGIPESFLQFLSQYLWLCTPKKELLFCLYLKTKENSTWERNEGYTAEIFNRLL